MRWVIRLAWPLLCIMAMLDVVFGEGLLFRLGAGVTLLATLGLTGAVWSSEPHSMSTLRALAWIWLIAYWTVQSGYRAVHGSYYELVWFAAGIAFITWCVITGVQMAAHLRSGHRAKRRWESGEPSL
jgi:hypothetical protein